MYKSTKTFGHELGISCAFRQWRAVHSHCSKLHGYAISFHFVFAAKNLDDCNWVIDFGGLKALKQLITGAFDHKTIVAADDPLLAWYNAGHSNGALDLVVLSDVGCEKFAEYACNLAQNWLVYSGQSDRVSVESVEVCEHGANSAIYIPARKGTEIAASVKEMPDSTTEQFKQIMEQGNKL